MNAPSETPLITLSVALPASTDAGPQRDAAESRQVTNHRLVLHTSPVANGQLAAAAAHESLA